MVTVMPDFVHFLVLLSIGGLFNQVIVQGNMVHEQAEEQLYDNSIVYREDQESRDFKINSLEIYNDKVYLKKVKEDHRLVAKFAKRIDEFHKTITSAVFAEKPGQNVIYSPISISTLMMMMTIGARGNTLSEIYNNLRLFFTKIDLYGFKDLIQIFKNTKDVELNFINQIFIANSYEIHPDYNNTISEILDSKIQAINFNNPTHAAELINNWCKKQTKNHITEITNPGKLIDVLLVLANAVYFKGDWEKPFDKEMNFEDDFHVSKMKSVRVSMMSMTGDFGWGSIRELKTKFVELPYKAIENTKDTYSMYVLVPDKVDGLALLEQNLHLIDYDRLNMIEDEIHISMPKFKLQSTLEFKPILQKMGISRMFGDSADFRGMLKDQTYVSSIVQKAFLEVNEKGSTAAAVTTADFANRMSTYHMKVDRPFLCAIVLKNLGIPLFYARVVDPSKLE